MPRIIWPSAVAALTLCGSAWADNFSYNKIDIELIGVAIDDGYSNSDIEGAGAGVSGSWEFSSHVFGYAGVSGIEYSYEDNVLGTGLQSSLGLGFNAPLGSKVDLMVGGSYERAKVLDDNNDELYESNGYGIRLGVRGLIGKRFDWNVGAAYVDMDDNGDVTFGAGFRVLFSRVFGMGLDLTSSKSHGVSTGTAALGFRFQFGDRDSGK